MVQGLLQAWLGWLLEGALIHQIFRVMAVLGLFMAIIQVVMRSIGLDHDVDIPTDADVDHGGGVLSWTTISGFLLAFGAVGSILMSSGYSSTVAILGGMVAGFALGAAFLFLMRGFVALKEDNTFRIASTVDQIGTVYVRIPAGGTGGQIQVVAQSRLVTLQAICEREVSSGERVRVKEVIGPDLVRVEPV